MSTENRLARSARYGFSSLRNCLRDMPHLYIPRNKKKRLIYDITLSNLHKFQKSQNVQVVLISPCCLRIVAWTALLKPADILSVASAQMKIIKICNLFHEWNEAMILGPSGCVTWAACWIDGKRKTKVFSWYNKLSSKCHDFLFGCISFEKHFEVLLSFVPFHLLCQSSCLVSKHAFLFLSSAPWVCLS